MFETSIPTPTIAPTHSQADPWETLNYERGMLLFLRHLLPRVTFNIHGDDQVPTQKLANAMSNVLCEATVLHVRQLCEILLSDGSKTSSIRLQNLLPGFESPAIDDLRTTYGRSNEPDSWRNVFNKNCMHADGSRRTSFAYKPAFDAVIPKIEAALIEVDRERARRSSDNPPAPPSP